MTTKLSGFDFDDNRSIYSRASSMAWLITRCLLIGLVGCSANDGSGSTSFGSGAVPSAGCTKAPDCAACGDCLKQCVCETGQQQSCLQACGGGSGGSGNAGGTSSFGGMSGSGFGGSNTGGTGGFSGSTSSGGTTSFGGSGGSISTGGTGFSTGGTGTSTGGTGTSTGGTGTSTGGTGTSTGGTGFGGSGGGPIQTAQDPTIPPVNGACPTFTNQTLNFMSLQGIQMKAGTKSNGTGILLFYWHGTGSSAGEVGLVPSTAQQYILNSGGIIISPQSSTGTTNGLTASGTSIWFDEDLTTADQIVACAVANYGIDPHRIYSTGCSAGGLMTGHMAAQRWQYIAAIAPNSGGALGATFTGDAHVPPVLTMHGAAGVDVVGLDFSQSSATLDQAIKSAGGFAVDCNHGGGHCQAPADLYTSAMQFLFDHPFGVSPEPYASGLPAGFPSYCVIQ